MATFKSIDQFRETLGKALDGNYSAQAVLKEAITTDDIPNLLRGVVNAELEEQYPVLEPVWQEFASSVDLQDFRPTAFYELLPDSSMLHRENGGETTPGGLPRVPELTPYPTFQFTSGEKFITTHKNGARIHFSFEAFINDEWDQIASLPAEMVQLAVDTEDIAATQTLVNSAGVNSTNFNANDGNVLETRVGTYSDLQGASTTVPANAELGLDALFAAIQQIKEQRHNGRSVTVNSFVLLVPPNLEQYANVLVNATQVRQTIDGRDFEMSNPLPASIKVVVNEWLTTINQGANAAKTWFLLPAGGKTANGRRTVVETFLRGRGTPEMRVSGNTGQYAGGGDVPYTEGSFDNDDAEVRLRHIVGGGFLGAGGTLVSDGSGGKVTPTP